MVYASRMKDDQVFYVAQKAFIRKGNAILVLTDPAEGLDFPGGKIQEGEDTPSDSLAREVMEETGLTIQVGPPFFTWISGYPAGHRNVGKKVFLIAYLCDYVAGDVSLSHEHEKFRWVTRDDYREADDGTQFFEVLEKYFTT